MQKGHAFIAEMTEAAYESYALSFALDVMGTDEGVRYRVQAGTHPDVLKISPDGASIKIGQVRNVIRELASTPYEGGKRLVVFFSADTMRIEAQNCLLKTLEEPPEDTVLLLLCASANKLLSTIRSRCILIRSGSQGKLEAAEQAGLSLEEARIAANIAQDPADAQAWAQAFLEQNGRYTIRQNTLSAIAALQKGNPSLESLPESREELAVAFSVMLSYYSDAMALCAGLSRMENSDAQDILSFWWGKEAAKAAACSHHIHTALSMLASNVSTKLCIQWLGLQLSEELQ